LSLLLAIDNRPTRLVVMAWHRPGDLASRMTKPFDGTVTSLASICLASASARQLLLCCGLRKMSSGANLAPESLRAVCASGTFQGAQVSDAHWPVTNKVDCREEFYSFPNQAFVSWRLGACQEWWKLLARSTRSARQCGDTMFLLSLLRSTTLIVAWRNPTLLPAMRTQRS
jgi:hypothetical protein